VPVETEVLRGAVVVGGHQVQADPPVGQVIERHRQPRGEVGRVERRRQGRHDAETPCRPAEHRRQRHRVELGHCRGVAEIPFRRALVGVGHKRAVFDQQIVKTGAIHGASEVEQQPAVGPIRPDRAGPWLVPGLDGVASAHKPPEMQHPSLPCSTPARPSQLPCQRHVPCNAVIRLPMPGGHSEEQTCATRWSRSRPQL